MGEFDFVFDNVIVETETKIPARIHKEKSDKDKVMIARQQGCDEIMPTILDNNTTYHLITSDSFGSIEILRNLHKNNKIESIYITTWSLSEDFIKLLEEILITGSIVGFYIDKSIRTRKAAIYAQLYDLVERYANMSIKLHYMMHSKVSVIKTASQYISIEGSANYSRNQRIENFTICTQRSVYDFHNKWIHEIVGK